MFVRIPVLIASVQLDHDAAADSSSDGVSSLVDVLSSSVPKPDFGRSCQKLVLIYVQELGKSDKKH